MNTNTLGCRQHAVHDCGCPGYPSLQSALRDCGGDCIDWRHTERCLRCQAADLIDRYKTRSERYLERIIELQETIEKRQLENAFGQGRLPLLKNQRHFPDPAKAPKKTFLKDDEDLEREFLEQ